MSIYYCPQCNKKYFIDNIEEVDENIQCVMCGCTIGLKNLNEEYEQKRQNVEFNKIDTTNQSFDNTYVENAVSSQNNPEDIFLIIQKKQLEELVSIKNMLKFFTVLTVISLVLSVLLAIFHTP